jgi:HK97 family phage major capsid protein
MATSRIKKVHDELAALRRDGQEIVAGAEKDGNRGLSTDELLKLSEFKAQREALQVELAALTDLQEQERSAPAAPMGNEDSAMQSAQRRGGEQPVEAFGSFGEMLQATYRAAQPDEGIDRRLFAAATGMNEAVGSEGGFLVTRDTSATIRERTYTTGQILSRVSRLPLSGRSNGIKVIGVDETSRADGYRFGGIRAYWTAEAGTKTYSQPKFRELDLKLKKLAAVVPVTDELLEDAVALEAWIMSHLPDELRFKAEDAILSGSGSGAPLGILTAAATTTGPFITVDPESGQTSGITWGNILAMWSRLYAPSRANAVWLIDQTVETALYTMYLPVGTGGVPVLQPANVAAGQLYPTLLGRPVIPVEFNQQLGTRGDIVLVDLSQYLWIDKGDVQSASSIHVRFLNDETVFRFVWRVDGQPEWASPLTPKNGGPTLAPAVLLGTRS